MKIHDLIPKWIGSFDYIHNVGTKFLFETNYMAPRGKVIMIDIKHPQRKNWVDVLPQHPKDVLKSAMYTNGLLMGMYMHNVQEVINVYKIDPKSHKAKYYREIDLPGIGSLGGLSAGWNEEELFYSFSSFTDPGSSYRVNTTSFETKIIHKIKVPDSLPDSSEFKTDQVWFESKDGTEVPMFIIRKKSTLPSLDKTPEKPIPTILYAYGGFGISITPFYSVSRLLFMDQMDGIFAVASIRGGGEFGEKWHLASIKEKKQTGFDDFIGAAEYLHE